MIFIDTGPIVARHLRRDQHHRRAVRGWALLRDEAPRCVTSIHVVDEALTLLARRAGGAFAAERGRRLLTSRALRVVRPGVEDEVAALEVLAAFADQQVSFTDAVSFTLMRRLDLSRAFSFDADFRLAGFTVWPEA